MSSKVVCGRNINWGGSLFADAMDCSLYQSSSLNVHILSWERENIYISYRESENIT